MIAAASSRPATTGSLHRALPPHLQSAIDAYSHRVVALADPQRHHRLPC